MKRNTTIIFFFSFCVFITTTAFSSDRRDFIVKFGIMKPSISTKDKLHETQKITMDPTRRPGWCFIVDPPDKAVYEVYSIHYLPQKPKQLTGDFKDKKLVSTQSGFKTAVERTDGIRPFCFDFHGGDPLGKYRVEVFINRELTSTLHLDVVVNSLNTSN